MKRILEELWYGNLCPSSQYREPTPEVTALMSYIKDHHGDLQATLTDKQKETLEKLDACCAELTDLNERDIFLYAFRLGARIAFAVMCPGTE